MDVQAYIKRAQAAVEDAEFELAERYYNQILSHYPDNPDALQGIQELEVARSKKKWSVVEWGMKLLWGQFLLLCKKPEKAHELLRLVHNVKPKSSAGVMAVARSAQKLAHFEEAHDFYRKAIKLNPSNAKALEQDAEILVHLERYEEAETVLKRLQSLRPSDDKITHRLRDISAKAYARVGIPEKLQERRAMIEKGRLEAIGSPEFMARLDKLQKAFELNPSNYDLGVEIAAHYREAQLYEQANQTLSGILDANPHFTRARREQARVWRQSGDLQIAAQLYEELRQESPDDRLLRDEYLDAQIAFKEKNVETQREDKDAWNEIEKLKLEREMNRIQYLENLLIERPEAFNERAEMSELLLKHGRVDDAITCVQRLMHELPFAGKGFFILGQCFRAKGDNNLAVSQFEKSLEFYKNRGYSHTLTDELKRVYYYMGMAKEATGDVMGAREAYGHVYSVDIHFKDVRQRYEKTFS
jgi:tetratricopeptide (TPR) repeat protein